MGIGTSLIVIAVGAILRFAVYRHSAGGFDIAMVGDILLIVGIIGLIVSIVLMVVRRRTDVYHHDEYVDEPPPPPRRFYYR